MPKPEVLSMWNVKSGKWNYCAAYNRELIFVGSAETINFTFHFTLFTFKRQLPICRAVYPDQLPKPLYHIRTEKSNFNVV